MSELRQRYLEDLRLRNYANFTQWCKENRNVRLRLFFPTLELKLRGYCKYYGWQRGGAERVLPRGDRDSLQAAEQAKPAEEF